MQAELGNGHSQEGPHDLADRSLFESVSRVERDVDDFIGALALLGVKRCSQCRQFFRSAEPGALFDSGQIVCYKCIPDWWSSVSTQMGVTDRERIEGKPASWLRKYHGAEVVKETLDKVPDTGNIEFQLIARCLECAGSGKLMEVERCRFCNGAGTVRIVVQR
jgi:hypothetical protein